MQQVLGILVVGWERLQSLSSAPFIALLVALAVLGILKHRKATEATSLKNLRRRDILTPNELEFYHRLRKALPQFQVFPQVSFDALLETSSDISGGAKTRFRNMYCQQRADFLICHPQTLGVIAVVELDDKSHRHVEKDKKRDAFLHAVGYRTERFQSKAKPSEKELANLFG